MSYDFTYQEICDMLRDHAETIAFDMLDDAKKEGAYVKGRCHGKCSVHVRGARVGLVGFWQGQVPGKSGGNLIKLIEISMGMEHGEAVRYAKSHYLGIQEREFTPEEKREWARKREQSQQAADDRRQQAEREKERRMSDVQRLWHQCTSLAGTPAEAYLRRRIGDFEWPPSLKYHPSMFCGPARDAGLPGEHPALVAAVQSVDRKLISLWRIFLTDDGGNLEIKGKKQKLGYGPSEGGMVRLTPVVGELNVGEGLESTLAARALNGWCGAWAAALSTSGLRGLVLPDKVDGLNIWSDGDSSRFQDESDRLLDPPGQSAMGALRQKYTNLPGSDNEPPEGSDWCDVWQTVREDC